jgi:hypothetical protein
MELKISSVAHPECSYCSNKKDKLVRINSSSHYRTNICGDCLVEALTILNDCNHKGFTPIEPVVVDFDDDIPF